MNIIERAITPFNPASSVVHNKDKYNLYAPMAGTNRIGMAAFNSEDFSINEQVVSIRTSVKSNFLPRADINNLPVGIEYSRDGFKTPNVWYYDTDGALLVTATGNVQLEFDITRNRFRQIILGSENIVGEWLDAPESIIELNNRLRVKLFLGTKSEIEAVAEKKDDTLYVPTDGMPDIEELIYRISVLENQLKNCTCGN